MSKVMVVDDAQADRTMIESILKTAGHQVLTYSDGERLEENLATELPDVLLLDVVMPKRNGYELLRRLKKDERTRHTPVVLVTCRDQDSDRLWGKRQGAGGRPRSRRGGAGGRGRGRRRRCGALGSRATLPPARRRRRAGPRRREDRRFARTSRAIRDGGRVGRREGGRGMNRRVFLRVG